MSAASLPGSMRGRPMLIVAELFYDDYAYVFEAYWDLWMLDESRGNWVLEPAAVKFIVQGEEFDEGAYQQTGHIEVDFGLIRTFCNRRLNSVTRRAPRFATTSQNWSNSR